MSDALDAQLFGTDGFFGWPKAPLVKGELAKRFGTPPFTVLNCREGAWQRRKAAWLGLGIKSELGRGANVLGHSVESGNMDFYKLKRELEAELRRPLSTDEAKALLLERGAIGGMDSGAGRGGNLLNLSKGAEDYRNGTGSYAKVPTDEARRREKAATPGGGGGPNSKYFKTGGKAPTGRAFNIGMNAAKENGWAVEDDQGSGTSIFDPVLCELVYTWFSPEGGQVVDPFAGGSVRGLVASCLGRRYWGSDLSAAQVAANRSQVGLLPPGAVAPVWANGDALDLVPEAPDADLVFACPPYFDLEVYSDDPADLSRMTWDEFRGAYNAIIAACAERLRPDRFAVFVVGDVRDEAGNYRDFPAFTTACFRRAGVNLYNDLVLVTAVGSLSIRTERQFVMSRKLGRTHQSVLIYCKGDARRATDAATGMSTDARRAALEARAAARLKAASGAAFEEDAT